MKIITTSITAPPKICIYGDHGVGKSTFGSECPAPIFIDIENGLGTLGVQATEVATDLNHVEEAFDYLKKVKHEYKTLVIDSADWLERLIFKKVADGAGVDDVSKISYGKGYKTAVAKWGNIIKDLNYLNEHKKMMIVLLAHAKVQTQKDPELGDRDIYQLDLYKDTAPFIIQWADILGFVNYRTSMKADNGELRAKGNGKRVIYLEERPAYKAKNRFHMPESLPFDEGESWATMYAAIKAGLKSHKKGNLKTITDSKVIELKKEEEVKQTEGETQNG